MILERFEITGRMMTLAVIAFCCVRTFAEDADLARLAREDYSHAVRPGGVEGRPFWNIYSRMYMYPPAFDFDGDKSGRAVKYLFTVHDSADHLLTFDADSPNASLAPVWKEVAPGFVEVWVGGVDKDGRTFGIPSWPRDRFSRHFWKSAPFKLGAYPASPRSYAQAAAMCCDEIFSRKATHVFLNTGKPDPDYLHNCYPSKMHSALISAMVDYAKTRPDRAADALKLARIATDYLVSISLPSGSAYEYMPPTYEGTKCAAATRGGQNMLRYPAAVGSAYLKLDAAVMDGKYVAAAKRIAETYLKRQEADGTWPVLVYEKDGKPVNDHRLQPMTVATFLLELYEATKDVRYRDAADRAFAWVEKGPMKTWFWEGQFEDSPLLQPYENLTKYSALEAMQYVLRRYSGDKKYLAFARDALRYAEDQFVCWEKPCQANHFGVNSRDFGPGSEPNDYDHWFYPCVLEQYVYYVPVDASVAEMVKSYLLMYKAEGNPLDLAKARALGDSLVRIQYPNGYIPTEVLKEIDPKKRNGGWLNCTCSSVEALAQLAAVDGYELLADSVIRSIEGP